MKTLLLSAIAALIAFAVVFTALTFSGLVTLPSAQPKWVVRPLGLSLRVAALHPRGQPPTDAQALALYTVGKRAQLEIMTCIAGIDSPPPTLELVFEEGIVSPAGGAITQKTAHGTCVNQVIEGLWGEVEGEHRLQLSLTR